VIYGSTPSNDTYEWIITSTNNTYTIKNKSTGHYMNIANNLDYIECSAMQTTIPSAQWALELSDSYYRIRNATTTDKYIHTENRKGYPECAIMQTTWHSAQWTIGTVSGSFDLLNSNRVALPNPSSNPTVFAFADVPRVVPPAWGYNVAPSGSSYPDVNGWDFTNNANDVYVFLPDGDGKQLRLDYITLTGRSEMIPRYALGCWDSRYYAYSQSQALGKIDTFRTKQIPIDVFVVDTDWRVGASIGYGVNTTLFPNMTQFLTDAHNKHVKIIFNDHPEPQATDCLKPAEVLYRNNGLRGLFDIGLDMWWFDRNWSTCIIPPAGINKEVFGMYIYQWVTKDYYPNRRPFIMANVDGIDNGVYNRMPNIAAHRYTCQWTGDLSSNMSELAREVKNMLTYGIIGPFPYMSADLGGHNGTPPANEYCRWLEYGALSPMYRPHCTQNQTRTPWEFAAPVEEVYRTYSQLRMRLLPVLYAAARTNYDTGEPLLRRCDLEYPDYPAAQVNDQYLLGDILVAPCMTTATSRTFWLPPGTWVNCWTGDTLIGNAQKTASATIKQLPMYVKQGTIIPLAPDMQYTTEKLWSPITLDVYPSVTETATAKLYEDDGVSNGYKTTEYRTTQCTAVPDDSRKTITVTIAPAQGTYQNALTDRSWIVRVRKPKAWPDTVWAATVDGQNATWSTYAKNSLALPFQATGETPDDRVTEIAVPAKAVSSTRTIVFYFDKTVPIRNTMASLSKVQLSSVRGSSIMVNCVNRPSGSCRISLSVLSLKGQLVYQSSQTTDRDISVFPITGNNGMPMARGMYCYKISIEQKGMKTFQSNGKALLMP
ncbi:MAG: TIM-barrel domain-containing protein, partial [Pseudomonadota bacterium]